MKSSCFKLLNRTIQKFIPHPAKNSTRAGKRDHRLHVMAVALAASFPAASFAAQGLVNVDVNNGFTFSGAGVLGSTGDIWNEINSGGLKQFLADSTGSPSAVSLNITGVGSIFSDTGGSDPANNPATVGLLADYLYVNNSTLTFQLTGLAPNSSYNLVSYAAGDSVNQNVTFSGAITTTMGPISRGAFVLGANYGQNTSAVSDASGSITFSTSASGFQGFNGLQIFGEIPPKVGLTGYATVPIGGQRPVVIAISAHANQSQAVTVLVTNSTPATISLAGAVNNVLSVTFPQGGAISQTLTVQGVALGTGTLTGNAAGATFSTTVIPASGLVGHWLAGQQDLTDTSGYSPAGTHDGVGAPGGFSSDPGFNPDVPPGFSGSSADLGLNGCMIQILNTSQATDGANYNTTFDDLLSQQMSVSFWAKFDANTTVGSFQPYISKRGEEAAWQIRTAADQPITSFTVRGTQAAADEFNSPTKVTDNNWHHIVASRDGVTGQRKLYIDGQLSGFVPNDFGSYSVDRDAYLILGGKWSQQNGTGGMSGGQFFGELFDVRIYAEALNGSQVQNLYQINNNNVVAFAETPTIDAGHAGTVSIAIPDGANATQAVSVSVTNTSGLVSVVGYTGTVFTVVFPAGAPNTLDLQLTAGATEGVAQLSFGSASLNSASVSVFVSGQHLVGQWGTNSTLADLSGYANYNTTAGTHSGVQVGGGTINFSTDVPNTKAGNSLDFSAGNVQVLITNSSVADSNYRPTFDGLIGRQFSVAGWVKGSSSQNWAAFAAKRGDDDLGWQARRYAGNNGAAFTLRGTSSENADMGGNLTVVNDGNWHHVAAVWDGYAGVRRLYVDGVLDTSLTNDFAPFTPGKGYHLMLGAQENRGFGEGISPNNQFTGKLYDVRVYNYPLSSAQVLSLATLGAVQMTGANILPVGNTNTITVSIPNGANQSSAVTVNISSGNTSVATIAGAVSNVKTLTFAAGGSISQTIGVIGTGGGKTTLTATSAGIANATFGVIVFAQGNPQLVGHWLAGSQTLADISGFTPAGTHDGVAVGSTPTAYNWDADVPAGYSGSSLDLTANGSGGQVGIMVTNSSVADNNYQVTFDNGTSNKFTVAFWAKGYQEGTWNPFVSKNGESTAWQFRMNPNQNDNPSFTVRGTSGSDDNWAHAPNVLNDGNWHHYAGTYDSQTGFRATYVDGKRQLVLDGDTGGFTPAPNDHLMLGAKDTSGFNSWYNGQLFDVRIYNYAISSDQVSALANPPAALSAAVAYTNVAVGETVAWKVTIPNGANNSSPVTVTLTDNAPGVATLVGAVNNVLTITFPAGTLPVQTVYAVTVAPGNINITATMGATSVGLSSASTVYAHALIGHWLAGSANLTDTSGFTPAGTHDGFVVGSNPASVAFSTDVPAGFAGDSLDLTANGGGANIGVAITNSSSNDNAYRPTFDGSIATAFTVAYWQKGIPGYFNPFVSKAGENNIGWEARVGYGDYAFTIRGSDNNNSDGTSGFSGDSNWHQVTEVWDGVAGTRQIYVDGVIHLNLAGDFAPMYLAPAEHLAIGARESASGWDNAWFNGLIYDVRMYNYPLSANEVTALTAPPAAPVLKITRSTGNTVMVSWSNTATGYVLQTNSSLTGTWGTSSLTAVNQGGQFVATDVSTNKTIFYRLLKAGN